MAYLPFLLTQEYATTVPEFNLLKNLIFDASTTGPDPAKFS